MDSEQREKIKNLIKKYKTLCADPDSKLTFTTRVVATIRTNCETPTCSKFYAYPIALKEEIEGQVKKLLEDGNIRPSRSPYNSPVWVVPKKQRRKKT